MTYILTRLQNSTQKCNMFAEFYYVQWSVSLISSPTFHFEFRFLNARKVHYCLVDDGYVKLFGNGKLAKKKMSLGVG
jgi:hypothetical protein